MRVVVLAGLLAPLVASPRAHANQCNAYVPQVVTPEIPKGCPLVAFVPHDDPARRALMWTEGGQYVDVTGTVESTTVELEVQHSGYDAQCVYGSGTTPELYDELTITLTGIEVGDTVFLDGGGTQATIVAAAACPTIEPPYLFCDAPYNPECDDSIEDPHAGHDHGGCNAGGGLGIAAAALLAGLRRRRRATSR